MSEDIYKKTTSESGEDTFEKIESKTEIDTVEEQAKKLEETKSQTELVDLKKSYADLEKVNANLLGKNESFEKMLSSKPEEEKETEYRYTHKG